MDMLLFMLVAVSCGLLGGLIGLFILRPVLRGERGEDGRMGEMGIPRRNAVDDPEVSALIGPAGRVELLRARVADLEVKLEEDVIRTIANEQVAEARSRDRVDILRMRVDSIDKLMTQDNIAEIARQEIRKAREGASSNKEGG